MNDQADKLRQAIHDIKLKNVRQLDVEPVNDSTVRIRPAKVFTVTSGKGGVGKTNVTVNLAIALSEMGYKVVMIDADFGLSNIEILFGVTPEYTLFDVIYNDMSILETLCDGPSGLKFISGGSGIDELMRVDREDLSRIVANLSVLDKEFDVVLIDTGAGMTDTVISMALAADEVILVTTPEPTSVTDAYALVKTVVRKDKEKIVKVIINKADNPVEAIDVLSKLMKVTGNFLNLKLHKLGYILYDNIVVKSVKRQEPFIIGYPKSQAAKSMKYMAECLVNEASGTYPDRNTGMTGFIKRLSRVFNFQT